MTPTETRRVPVVLTLLAALLILGVAFRELHGGNQHDTRALHPTVGSADGRWRVAIVNCNGYHFEILSGFANVLAQLKEYDIDVYVYRKPTTKGSGEGIVRHTENALSLLRNASIPFNSHDCSELLAAKDYADDRKKTAAVVYITAQDDLLVRGDMYNGALRKFQPKHVLNVVHHSNQWDRRRHFALFQLAAAHPYSRLLSLSPLTLDTMNSILQLPSVAARSGWFLPILPFKVDLPCASTPEGCPLSGFAVQGNLDSKRRNYGGLFKQMMKLRKQMRAANVTMKLIGKETPHAPVIPAKLGTMVQVFSRLGFKEFYTEIALSIALVPIVGESSYLEGRKITSTLVTSLITGVPVLADAAFQQAYDFVPDNAFYMQHPEESLGDALVRVASMTHEQHMEVRDNLEAARDKLLQRNTAELRQWLDPDCPEGVQKNT